MDKYELKITINEIDSLIERRRLREAADVADSVDWRRVKNVRTLCRVSDVYKINRRYEDSKRILELAYAKNPYGRQIIFSMCELELKLGNYVRALQLYNEYINVAPRDTDRYVLQYKLYKEQNVSVNERIAVLEEMARHDMRDRWAYELARLYLEAGERNLCASQCDEIIAFFGDGRYVLKALELKASFAELTLKQKALYRKMTGEEEEESSEAEDAPEPDTDTPEGQAPSQEDTSTESTTEDEKPASEEKTSSADPESGQEEKASEPAEQVTGTDVPAGEEAAEAKEPQDEPPREEVIPTLNQDPAAGEIPWEYEDYEIEAKELKKKMPAADAPVLVRSRRGAQQDKGVKPKPEAVHTPPPAPDHSVFEDNSFEIGADEEALFSPENMQKTIAKGLKNLENYDTYLRQETDGQYAMVMQEARKPDKQITGQLNLEEIMSEWEKVKRDFYETNGPRRRKKFRSCRFRAGKAIP